MIGGGAEMLLCGEKVFGGLRDRRLYCAQWEAEIGVHGPNWWTLCGVRACRLWRVPAMCLERRSHSALPIPPAFSSHPTTSNWLALFFCLKENYNLRISPQQVVNHHTQRDSSRKECKKCWELRLRTKCCSLWLVAEGCCVACKTTTPDSLRHTT